MNVGDYVRTNCGIAKIVSFEGENILINIDKAIMIYHENYWATCTKEEIIKSSPNIIDLIEVGDYVNGYIVIKEVPKDKRKKQTIILECEPANDLGEWEIGNNEIETIVTHEQFSQMEYKVGERDE